MIVFTTFHTENYNKLAEITLEKNKKVYCEKHGYPLICKTDGWHNIQIFYEKCHVVWEALKQYPHCDWVYFSDCDTMITNMSKRLEDFVKDTPPEIHLVIASDLNGVNSGNFFFRNSDKTKDFLYLMLNNIGKFQHEQDFIMDAWNGSKFWKEHIDVRPQREFNSYDYSIYDRKYGEKRSNDWFGNDGNWQPGDFMIHFVACNNDERIELAKKYISIDSESEST